MRLLITRWALSLLFCGNFCSDLRTDKLKYLNIDQALADLAHFVVEMRKTIPGAEKSGVIMIGGSYSATMVSWFRQKYPHLINGAWASSAPVFAKVEFTGKQWVAR